MPSQSSEEYRDSQRLLALKIRLSEKNLPSEERKEIERLIEGLEKKINLCESGDGSRRVMYRKAERAGFWRTGYRISHRFLKSR